MINEIDLTHLLEIHDLLNNILRIYHYGHLVHYVHPKVKNNLVDK